jgi:hypothetical protein
VLQSLTPWKEVALVLIVCDEVDHGFPVVSNPDPARASRVRSRADFSSEIGR